jgi:WD40-like Beta Propeller Repeat
MILSVWAVCVLMLTACEVAATFPCATDPQCRRGDVTGTCEPTGFCSFVDANCDSGARYDESAGDDLASTCVPPTVVPPTDCSSEWFAHTIQFNAGVALAINSTLSDRDPFVTADGLTLYFGSNRNGGTGVDIWSASRASITSEFADPVIVTALNSKVEDTKVSMTQDMLDLTITSERNGTVDVFEATRIVATTDFGPLMTATMANVNNGFDNEYDAALDGDGLRLYLAPDKPVPQHISMATRSTRADVFAAPVELTELTSGAGDADPAPSLDERIIVFTSDRAGSTLGGNLWYATRASSLVPFETPQPLPGVQTDANEGDAFLTADLCTLYYASAAVGDTNYDLYRATVVGN